MERLDEVQKGTCGWWHRAAPSRSLEVGWGIGRGLHFFFESLVFFLWRHYSVEEENES